MGASDSLEKGRSTFYIELLVRNTPSPLVCRVAHLY